MRVCAAVLVLGWATRALAGPGDVSVTAAFQSDSLALPWTQRFDAPLHPGVRVGAEWQWASDGRHRLIQSAALGYSSAVPAQRLAMLLTEAGYRYQFDLGVQLEALVALGYGHEFPGETAYAYDARAAGFVATPTAGRPQLLAGVALGVGFDARPLLGWPVDVFARYESLFQLIDSPTVPVLPHTVLLAGLRWHL